MENGPSHLIREMWPPRRLAEVHSGCAGGLVRQCDLPFVSAGQGEVRVMTPDAVEIRVTWDTADDQRL
jgi:hypothetical protein